MEMKYHKIILVNVTSAKFSSVKMCCKSNIYEYTLSKHCYAAVHQQMELLVFDMFIHILCQILHSLATEEVISVSGFEYVIVKLRT